MLSCVEADQPFAVPVDDGVGCPPLGVEQRMARQLEIRRCFTLLKIE